VNTNSEIIQDTGNVSGLDFSVLSENMVADKTRSGNQWYDYE
jgi:hypothetical protein